MVTLRGTFPTQIETRCEAGHLYRYSPLAEGKCPLCANPRRQVVPKVDRPSRQHKEIPAGERAQIVYLRQRGESIRGIRDKVRRGTDAIRRVLKEEQ